MGIEEQYNITIVSQGVCDTVAYFEEGATYSALAPRDTICPGKESTSSDSVVELSTMIQITTLLGMVFLLIVTCRSCSRIKVDWYRLLFLYVLGSIGVPVSIALGPQYGGFNRISGFGVLVHNMAELFIIGRIWLGMAEKGQTSRGVKFVVMYVWILLTLLTFLPLSPLFLIAMCQGGFCDWFLVFTFLRAGLAMQQYKGKYFWYGFAAALTHILSIQPLFFGFATALLWLRGVTAVFLVPTFIIYLWFASADSDTPARLVQPNSTSFVSLEENIVESLGRIEKEIAGIELGTMKKRNNENNDEKKTEDKIVSDALQAATHGQTNEKDKTVLRSVLDDGLFATEQGKNQFWMIVGLAVFAVLTNGALVYFSPCYISTKSFCDE